jgi:hypothetical protein
MTESSYTDILVNTNSSNLVGYLDRQNDYFRVTNKNFSSWSFDGYISSFSRNIVIWDKANRQFNFGAGDYLSIIDADNVVSNYQITSVTTDPDSSFFDDSLFPQGKGRVSVTAVSGNGTQIVYTAANNFVAGQRVRISGVSPDGYSSESALIVSRNATTFTVAGTQTGTATLTSASVELVTSFLSNVYVRYLDENLVEQVYTIVPVLVDGYPVNRLNVIQEDWKSKGLGSNGWLLTSSGNAIFNNIAVRGEIEATSGNFLGNLTVNNGTMKLGAGVNRANEYSISSVSVSSNRVLLTTDSTTESSDFAIGDTIIVSDLDLTETGFMDLNGIFTVSYVSSTQVGYDFKMPDTGPFATSVGYVALESANDGIFINTNNYWYSDGTFKFGNDTNNVNWNTELLVPRLEISGDVYANSGRIGSLSSTSSASWTIGTGLIRSGTGTSTVALASPALNFADTANQTINRYTITKLVIDSEGGGLSTLYLHITVPNLETFLETELATTINTAEELSSAVYDYFSTKPILFQSTDIFSTTLNPNFKTATENRWLNVQMAGDYSVSLVSGDVEYATSPTANLVVLEFWGEDYGYTAFDETITTWTTKQIDVLSGSTGSGNYVFWTGSELAEDAPFSIDTDGSLYSQNISSGAMNADIANVVSFILDGHTVSISAVEPESPIDGDIWIEII